MSDDDFHCLDDMGDFDWIAEVRDSAWAPSACLTAERIMALKGDLPAISSVLALLAFNDENFRIPDNAPDFSYVAAGAETLRVGKHLFEAARRGCVKIWGRKHVGDELEQILATTFEEPYEAAANDETAIEISLDQISSADANERIETKERGRWRGVRVDKATLCSWLCGQIEPAKQLPNQPMADETPSHKIAGRRPQYVPEKRQFVINLLKEIFPDGIPPKDKLPDAALRRLVTKSEAFAAKEPSLSISPDTILRAAGRRSK